MKPFKEGDLLISPQGLIGRLRLQDGTRECSVHSIDDNPWQVRAWSTEHLRKGGWRHYPPLQQK